MESFNDLRIMLWDHEPQRIEDENENEDDSERFMERVGARGAFASMDTDKEIELQV